MDLSPVIVLHRGTRNLKERQSHLLVFDSPVPSKCFEVSMMMMPSDMRNTMARQIVIPRNLLNNWHQASFLFSG